MNRLPRIVFKHGMMIFAFIAGVSIATVAQAQQGVAPSTQDSGQSSSSQPSTLISDTDSKSAKTSWITLSDHWEACSFGGEGDVTIKDGVIKMEYGDPLTGVRWAGPFEGDKSKPGTKKHDIAIDPLPRDNYEVRWECRREKGFDFLCALTFPIADQHASLVMGGWGGGITGISSIDSQDASDNNTTMFINFDDKKWYKARIRVDESKITVWIDGKELFDVDRKEHEFDIRFEMDPCTPLGIANFECDSLIRNIQIRRLESNGKTTSDTSSAKKGDE